MIKDQIIFSKNTDFLQTKCFSCSSKGHIVAQCPLIHYIPDPIKIVKNSLKEFVQYHRQAFERSRSHGNKFNSRFARNYVQNCSTRFRFLSKNEDLEEYLSPKEGSASHKMFSAISASLKEKEAKKDETSPSQSKRKLKINTNIDKISLFLLSK